MPAVARIEDDNNKNNVSSKMTNEKLDSYNRCSNPFRIPQHFKMSGLRNVPRLIRERLAHVHFGAKICCSCRHRVYAMLKERKQLKPSVRLRNSCNLDRRRSEQTKSQPQPSQQQRRSEPAVPVAAASAVKQVTMTVTASSEADKRAIESLFNEDEQDIAGSSGASCAVSNLEVESSALLVHAMSRRSRPQPQQQQQQQQLSLAEPEKEGPVKQICCFCGLTEDNEVEFGKFYQHRGIVTHYYCLLLSSNMEQKGNDDEGILGFLADDIQKEIRRGKRLVCSYCKKNGATLGCCNAKCKRIFHFPCGLKAGSLHQFFGEFRSYCINHRPKQKIDDRVKKEIENMKNILCYICYEDVAPLDSNGTLWAPCCKKNAWFHRKCVQQLAMSAGYFFKCPLCNNKREFQTAMLEYGIYIPRQDASWELVPNAFQELLYRHDHCDAAACLCPKGRTYTSSNAKWELILCRMCGSQGTHIFCGGLKWVSPVWECQECISITKKSTENIVTTDDSTTRSNDIPIQRETTLNVTIRESDEDSDSDISVGNESIPLETNLTNIPAILPEVKLRPGPRSFKMQQVQKLQSSNAYNEIVNQTNNSLNHSNTTVNNAASNSVGIATLSAVSAKVNNDVICIDSDDEAIEIVCENVTKRHRHQSELICASTSNSSNFSNRMNCVSPKVSNVLPEEIDDSPFNIIISNVTSLAPEFFASVPELTEEEEIEQVDCDLPIQVPDTPSTNGLKRSHPTDEEIEVLIVDEAPKRARLEINTTIDHNVVNSLPEKVTSVIQNDESSSSRISGQNSVEPELLSNVKDNPSKTETQALPSTGSADEASSAHDNCHRDAGTGPAILNTDGQSHEEEAATAADTQDELPDSPQSADTKCPVDRPELAIRTVLENGSSSHCSSSGGSGGSSKSRFSSGDRSGLIPDFVRLSDLKFRVCGSDVELSYRTCRIQVKMNGLQSSNSTTLNDASSAATALVSSFAGSNQHLSSEKSSKSYQLLLSDDSTDESDRIHRSLRTRSLRSFVYEDDNTLLEYPTSANDALNNAKKSLTVTEKRLTRSDWKENWDPEVSSSSNNDFDSAIISNKPARDLKDGGINNREISSKTEEHSLSQSQKEEPSNTQRLLRRSNRIVRHFRSVQQSELNDQINGDSTDSNTTTFSPSFGKSNQMASGDRTTRSSRSLKVLNGSSDVTVQQDSKKHLKNVDIDELKFTLTNKINGAHNNNDVHMDADFKVSIDLQKISNLISAKPDLFFKTKNNGVRRLRVYSVDEKLKVEFKSGETKFLTKSQSFDCLLDVANDGFSHIMGKSRSLDCLSNIDSHNLMPLTDLKDCMEIKTRRSQRRKARQFEKHECVRNGICISASKL
ncbi:hypothetical protein TSAR_002713 [Trichomalopsis sarcophagae]|uniref:Uncharacterized protein n=1 Tax=Trichomalopsis sarcophagae TaxID=543379 RepID=A0A232F367_9HYME|nr:hypothetical protein TSAR_002713 [Trichomalopsis sarcophagae]